jgi:hypothetical protein
MVCPHLIICEVFFVGRPTVLRTKDFPGCKLQDAKTETVLGRPVLMVILPSGALFLSGRKSFSKFFFLNLQNIVLAPCTSLVYSEHPFPWMLVSASLLLPCLLLRSKVV